MLSTNAPKSPGEERRRVSQARAARRAEKKPEPTEAPAQIVETKVEPEPTPEPEPAGLLSSFVKASLRKLEALRFDTQYVGKDTYRLNKGSLGPLYFSSDGLSTLVTLAEANDAEGFALALKTGERKSRYSTYLTNEGATTMIKEPGQGKTTKDTERAKREARGKTGTKKGAATATKKSTKTTAPKAPAKKTEKAPVDQSARTAAVLAKIKKAGKFEHRSLANSTEKKIARQLMRDGIIKRESIDGVLTYIA